MMVKKDRETGIWQLTSKEKNVNFRKDVLIKYLDDIFYGLTNGGGKYQLTTLNDQHYQKKLTELHTSWLSLKDEISLVREKGYQQTNIIKMSEEYFYLADETVTAAEDY